MTGLAGALADPGNLANPYPLYDMIRGMGRVLWVKEIDRWLITGHDPAITLLGHPGVSVDRHKPGDDQSPLGFERQPRVLPFLDPPDHTRLRALVQQAFTQRAVQQLRPQISKLVDELLTAARERGEMDLIADFAGPLPAIVLADLLGIPATDHALFRSWATTIIESIDPVSLRLVSEESAPAHASLEEYLTGMIEERRKRPQQDLISGMIDAEESGDRLTPLELLDMCLMLTIVGVETTTSLIANGVSALLEHPDRLAQLRSDPDLIKTAVEELLRYDAPVQLAGRRAVEDIEVDGQTIRKGHTMGIVLGAANRDPAVFTEPNSLDLTRSPNNHIAFGRGIHFCLGSPMARTEGAIAIAELVTRFPRLRSAGEAKRRANVHVRGFMSMPLALT
jgi:pimeloyl-[acyl-carrier protein] synthase